MAAQKAIFSVGDYTVREGPTGGYLLYRTTGQPLDLNVHEPISIHNTRDEAIEAAKGAPGMARGGAAQADDDALTEEELAQVNRAWRGLIEDHAHGGKMHYNMPPVAGMAPPGSFRIPKDVFEALGQGDLKLGGAVAHAMFGIEDDPEDPTVVHPHAVRIIGNGSLAAGQKVLQRFVSMVRRQSRAGVTLVHNGRHDDDDHGWRVGR
jgi:hypothetical protein